MIGTVIDTGPLVALIDADDDYHVACTQALAHLTYPMVTTWPCFTEAMYLIAAAEGHRGQDTLWSYVENGDLTFHELTSEQRMRMRVLMAKYKDTPMDLADASLVAAAEALGTNRIFTIDSDFHIYRLTSNKAFEIVP